MAYNLYESKPLKNYCICSFHQNPDELNIPKSNDNIDLSRYSNSIF